MKQQTRHSTWYYAAAIIFAVGGATGCLYSAAAAAAMIGYSLVKSARTARARHSSDQPETAVRFGIASQLYDSDSDASIEPTGLVISAAA